MDLEDDVERVQTEERPCPACGKPITAIKMDFRFAGRYTCPHCGREVILSDVPDA